MSKKRKIVLTGYSAIILAILTFLGNYVKGKHDEAMGKIEVQEQEIKFQKEKFIHDSTNNANYQEWANNKFDSIDCNGQKFQVKQKCKTQ